MNKFSIELLLKSYQHFLDTHFCEFKYLMKTSDELLLYTEAAAFLSNEKLIAPISQNIFGDSIRIPDELELEFELTSAGISKAKEILESKR